jgi:hypothetical protein
MRELNEVELGQIAGGAADPDGKAFCKVFRKLCKKDFPNDECDAYYELCLSADV